MRGRFRVAAAAAAVLAVIAAMPAAAAFGEEYPTWSEVEAAKSDVAARETEAARITAFVDGLEAEAGRLGDAAVTAAAASAAAETAHRAASDRAATLRASADAATVEAEASAARLGRVGAMLARSGGADVPLRLLFGPENDVDLLEGLSRAAQLTNVFGAIADRAEVAEAASASLSAQAEVAESERARLAREAADAADDALTAHEAAEARLSEQRSALETLYAQLASLRDRTVQLERLARVGDQKRQEEERARAAAAAAAAANDVGDSTAPPPGVVVDPAGAKAYAAGAIGRYGWGGGEYQCLVQLWTRESSWRADAYNASSGAYGIPQSLPGSKMAVAGADWRTNAATQIDWGLAYISARYGSPCGAWAHSERYNWY
ncbi:hypothetical protein [Agromyces ramosus]|uniref:Chemotaxis protein histidine kinase CheA n=1 Tax=Agromyces ramosus TaxID=33879 RepID=A0ABU0RE74_9MICO|nr:hypothetical protein [Agromyces ramosus]MDQ0896112.1 chemotaxis protein histidine kinase CheA [Agromyces ramosus]